MRALAALACAAALGAPSCHGLDSEVAAPRSAATAAWDEYVKATIAEAPHGLQPACVPRRFEATAPYKGTAVFFHGFSACPQMFFDLAPLLAAEGYDVLVPLLPGHGNAINATGSPGYCPDKDACDGPIDDVTGLPDSPEGYISYVKRITHIAAKAPGERVVAGLSVGGALTSYASHVTHEGKPIFSRQLVMNPMLRVSYGSVKLLTDDALEIANNVPYMREWFIGWGKGCRDQRALGRGGICTFAVKHVAAARDAAHDTLKFRMHPGTKTAIIYDHQDPVINTETVRELISAYGQPSPQNLSHCVMSFTSHSMCSSWDSPHAKMWWMNELYCKIVGFLVRGEPFPTAPPPGDAAEAGERFCHLDCTKKTCHFDPKKLSCPSPERRGSIIQV